LFEVQAFLNGLDPSVVRVELYANGIDGAGSVLQQMERVGEAQGTPAAATYRATISATRPAQDYTARLIPHHADVAVPMEVNRILWQR
jgi:starch phosphorylase